MAYELLLRWIEVLTCETLTEVSTMRNKFFYGMLTLLACALIIAWAPSYFARTANRSDLGKASTWLTSAPVAQPSLQKPAPAPATSLDAAKQTSQAFVEVARKVTPSIVMITNEAKIENQFGDENLRNMFGDDFFGQFFNMPPQQRDQIRKSIGSGVVLSADGYIITNNHVVDNSTKLQVTLPDGKKISAKIIGADPKTDLALIKVDGAKLQSVTLGHSDDIEVGEWVLAIGSPFGEALQHTVTAGIISARGRSNVGIADYEDFIQTDAAINPGNSGGALVDLDGNLIGINTAIVSSNGSNAGVGFAIPVDMVKKVAEQLKADGRVIRGYLGITIQDLTPELQKSLGIKEANGAVVSDLQKGAPGEKAGLKPYDVITSVNGQTVKSNADLRDRIASLKPGSHADLTVIRDGKEQTIGVTVGEMKNDSDLTGKQQERNEKMGMELQTLTPELAQRLGTDRQSGVVVTNVMPNSAADDAGLQKGDVIFEANRKEISSVADFKNAVSQNKDNAILLAVERQGNSFFVTIELG
jgi:serine protease Do